MKRRLLGLAVTFALVVLTAASASAQATVPISGLPPAGSVAAADLFACVHGGVTSKCTGAQVWNPPTASFVFGTPGSASFFTWGDPGTGLQQGVLASGTANCGSSIAGISPVVFCMAGLSKTVGIVGDEAGDVALLKPYFGGPAVFAGAGSCGTTAQTYICQDAGAIAGLQFNLPTSTTNGYRFMVNGTVIFTLAANGAATFTGPITAPSVSVSSLIDSSLATSAPVCTDTSKALVTTACAIAIIGANKTALTIAVGPTATALATPAAGFYTRAFMLSTDLKNPTIDGSFAYCDNAGGGGAVVGFKWYESFGASPTFSTANPISTELSWATTSAAGGGATFAPTALPTSTTPGNPTWVFAVVNAIPTTAPGGVCTFYLQGLQAIQ